MGVKGDPNLTTAEKGDMRLAAAVAGLEGLIGDFQGSPIRGIQDKYAVEQTNNAYDTFRPM